jgi:hypothetical protein
MTENAKTITFVVVGLVAIAVGLISRPTSAELDESSLVNQNLTKKFDSADEAKRLKIVRFNEDTATLRDFEVAERDGLWTIPSKSDYPADAARQMAEAATSLMDRKILSVASMSAGDHEQFGVVDPLSPKLEVGQQGVGTHVTMYDVHDEPLADLVIGKAVKDADGQRYVREAGRDIVYVIEIDPTKLSTNFEDWIEKDLLKLNSWDLQQVEIKDYSAELVPVMTQDGLQISLSDDRRSEMTLAYNDSDAKWNAVKLRKFDTATEDYTDFTLAEDEELNTESLNALKTALDDLQIVDVVRKPQGMSNDLKTGADFMKNEETLRDLMRKGFTPMRSRSGAGEAELVSSDGEVIAAMKNGTEYVLRFGALTNVAAAEGDKDQAADAAAGAAETADAKRKDGGVHRYLFVMARFNEGAVKRPELEDLPELPAKDQPPANDAQGESATGETPSTDPASGESASADGNAPDASTAANGEESTSADTSQPNAQASDDAPAESDAKPAATETNAETAAAAADETEKTDDPQKTEGEATTDSDKDKDLEKIIADRKRIEEENQRKLDEYQKSLEEGRQNVKDLNLRFGDWYFVVADDVFKKIRLSRENVIKKKEKKEDAAKTDSADATTNETSAPASNIPGLPPIPGTSN